jgi:hypothetical protein
MNSINLQEEYAKTEIAKLLNLLDEELVGLAPVKARIREIAALLLIDKLRKNLGKIYVTFTSERIIKIIENKINFLL